MTADLKIVWQVARHELMDSIRSRRVIIMGLLYLAGSIVATAIFITVLQKLEGQLTATLGLATSAKTGSVTATLWKSDGFRQMMIALIGDKALAKSLLEIPPLALFYGWLSFAFTPALVMLTSSARVSEEIWSGSARFVLFRIPRLHWCVGKFTGQAIQLVLALFLSAVGAWLTGLCRMTAFEPLATALAMLLFAGKAWIYSLAFLGLALGISQLCSGPNLALAMGFLALIVMAILSGISGAFAGEGWRRIWDLVNSLTPGAHRLNLWWGDVNHSVPAIVFLLTLCCVYLLGGYARFSRRDL
jgi:ABC-type transport system involved in multi-copper enzyme maturation permease subunit